MTETDRRKLMTTAIGRGGFRQFGGYIRDEWQQELVGRQGMLKYREMKDNDATIGALLFCMKMLIRNAKWSVQPASEDASDIANADFLEECLFSDADNSFDDVIAEACTMIEYGYSIMEMVFRRRRFSEGSKFNDGKIGIKKLGIRSQDTIWRWVFDEIEERDKILAVCQLTIPQGEMLEIPYEKCLHFKTEPNRDNPEGRSFLRNAYRSYVFKKNIEEIDLKSRFAVTH